ncbi:hypothetical protein GF357_01905 [Candidatus Dojkabacteria bacterium]|nr:hypothetical protein [Candidatus Dojkabacteria bacterium]
MQLLERTQLIQTLSDSGWLGRKMNELFDRDFWVHSEAIMDYHNEKADLILQYYVEKEKISFSIDEPSRRLDFVIKFGDKLQSVLDTIVSFQDQISVYNFKEYMRKVLQLGVSTYILVNDELVLLEDHKNQS